MLEYNADTPTSLVEAASAQWFWMEDRFPGADRGTPGIRESNGLVTDGYARFLPHIIR